MTIQVSALYQKWPFPIDVNTTRRDLNGRLPYLTFTLNATEGKLVSIAVDDSINHIVQ